MNKINNDGSSREFCFVMLLFSFSFRIQKKKKKPEVADSMYSSSITYYSKNAKHI